jgi:hypothetical protein
LNFNHQADGARSIRAVPQEHDHIAHLADLVAAGIEHGGAGKARHEDSRHAAHVGSLG